MSKTEPAPGRGSTEHVLHRDEIGEQNNYQSAPHESRMTRTHNYSHTNYGGGGGRSSSSGPGMSSLLSRFGEGGY